MAVCHTVIPEAKEDGSVHFNASSPDEKALVEGAERYGSLKQTGFKIVKRPN